MSESLLSAAEARALDQIAGSDGIIVGAAIDHRDAMAIELEKRGLRASLDEVIALKLRVAAALAPAATVLLLDAEHSAKLALAGNLLPSDTALVVPLEAQGYGDSAAIRRTTFLPGWDASKAAVLGAAGCKLLLPYRADIPEQSVPQRALARVAIESCRKAGVALILEPIVYVRQGESLHPDRFSSLVITAAEELAALRPTVLKLQYPGTPAACKVLDRTCGPQVPWVLLGGGAPAEELKQQVVDACAAGASGFIVGRTLFGPALLPDVTSSNRALLETSLPLLENLGSLARKHARPWRQRLPT